MRWPEVKDPADISWWGVDCTAFLSGDTIQTAAFTVPSGLTKVSETNTTTVAKVKLSGGATGTVYAITLDLTTAQGQTFQRTIELAVKELF